MKLNKTKIAYAAFGITALLFFLAQLYKDIVGRYLEMDLWTLLPTILFQAENVSLFQKLGFFFSNELFIASNPILKIFLYVIALSLGVGAANFIFSLLLLHILNAGLVFVLGRRLDLSFKASFFSSLTYLYFYPHFEIYFWPGNIQHIFVVTCVLAVLNLYLTAEKTKKRPYLFTAITLNLAATLLCRITVVIIPVIIICDILLNTGASERVRKFDRWFLLFFAYLLNPLYTLIFFGDDRLKIPILFSRNISGGWLVYSVFFLAGLIMLLFFRYLIGSRKEFNNFNLRKSPPLLILGFIIIFSNFLIPLVGLFSGYFRPIESALSIDSSHIYSVTAYKIIYSLDYLDFLLILASLAVFISKIDNKKNIYKLFSAWYFACLLFPWIRNTLVSSRYIGYIAPVFCLLLVPVIVYAVEYICGKIRFNKDIGLILFFIPVLLMNVMAIKLEVFRNKMITGSFIYDFIRTGNLIKQDMAGFKDKPGVAPVYVSGLKPAVMPEICMHSTSGDLCSCKADCPQTFYNFRFVFAQLTGNYPSDRLFINGPAGNEKNNFAYKVEGYAVKNKDGRDIDPFVNILGDAMSAYSSSDYQKASALFEAAIDRKPFLLNYLLEALKLEDLRWITGNVHGLSAWMDSMFAQFFWSAHLEQGIKWDSEKIKYIKQIIDREISDYIIVLFYRSYLSYESGNVPESEFWFKKIAILETNPGKISEVINTTLSIRPDSNVLLFLEKMCLPKNFTKFVIPESGSREMYKFLVRFFIKDL